jgi:hypothetical protein
MLGALVGTILTFRARWAARAALAVAFCIQFLDLLPMRQSIAHESALTEQSPLQSPIWWTLSKSNRHLIVLPARQCDPIHTPGGDPAWPWFADLAARSGMTLNSVHAARFSAQSDSYNCKLLPLELGKGKLESGTAYVLSDSLASAAAARTRTHVCRRVDAFNLCLSRDASESPLGQ